MVCFYFSSLFYVPGRIRDEKIVGSGIKHPVSATLLYLRKRLNNLFSPMIVRGLPVATVCMSSSFPLYSKGEEQLISTVLSLYRYISTCLNYVKSSDLCLI
jgi:hypothetical protein